MEQRRSEIVNLVNRDGSVTFARLKEVFPNVSEMTLRTDLKALDQARRLVRVHGGAKSVTYVVGTDDILSRRENRNPGEKTAIAQKAVGLLRPNDVIFLDSGSTAMAFARQIPDEDFLIFTTGIDCLRQLVQLKRPKIHILGGEINPASMCVTGVRALLAMQNIRFDVAVLGTTGYTPREGFTCGGESDAAIKAAAVRQSERAVMLMDSSKVGLASTFSFANLGQLHTVVTDDGIDGDFRQACGKAGVQLL